MTSQLAYILPPCCRRPHLSTTFLLLPLSSSIVPSAPLMQYHTQLLVAALPAVVGRPATRRQSGFQSCAPTLTSCLCTVLSIVTVTQSSYPPQQSGEDAMRKSRTVHALNLCGEVWFIECRSEVVKSVYVTYDIHH